VRVSLDRSLARSICGIVFLVTPIYYYYDDDDDNTTRSYI